MLNPMVVGCFSRGFGRKLGRYGCATDNCLWALGPWIGLVGSLGGVSHGKRYDADWGGLGFSLDDCLVVGWGRNQGGQRKG
jgi:hypothetical protein